MVYFNIASIYQESQCTGWAAIYLYKPLKKRVIGIEKE